MTAKHHVIGLGVALVCTLLVYFGVSQSYYCGYDDFSEVHRAQFRDNQDPSRIWTETHFGTGKYRPLHRYLTYVTWKLGDGKPQVFRFRNLFFHLVMTAFVYGITWLLFASGGNAATAALFFGIHPLANQSILGASWGVTAAFSMLLGSFYFFLLASRRKAWMIPLTTSFILTIAGLLIYEPAITIFYFIAAYLVLRVYQRRSLPSRAFLITLAVQSLLVLSLFVWMRFQFVNVTSPLTPPLLFVRNTLMFAGALALPVDSILAHEVFGTPLPSRIKLAIEVPILLALGSGLAAALVWRWKGRSIRKRMSALPFAEILFLLSTAGASLLPFLVFTDHPSETYLYMPLALWCIIIAVSIATTLDRRWAVLTAVALVLLWTVATMRRNARVQHCAATAERLLSGLPREQLRTGAQEVRFADAPGIPPLERYGLYGFRGLATIDPFQGGVLGLALQMISGNERVAARIVDAKELQGCSKDECFVVFEDGHTQAVGRPLH